MESPWPGFYWVWADSAHPHNPPGDFQKIENNNYFQKLGCLERIVTTVSVKYKFLVFQKRKKKKKNYEKNNNSF